MSGNDLDGSAEAAPPAAARPEEKNKWQSIHLNHKDRALHGFYQYRMDADGTLKVLKSGREFTDKRVHDFITKIAIPFAKELGEKASDSESAKAQPEPSKGNTNATGTIQEPGEGGRRE